MKKSLSIILTIAIILSFGIFANAEEEQENEYYTGVIFATNISDELSDAELLKAEEKIAKAYELSKIPSARTVTKISIPGSFTMYQQEKSYYCVPACIKSVLKYITSTTYTQTKIAGDINTTSNGTDNTKITPYLNEKQDAIYYLRSNQPTESQMCTFLHSTITYNEKPAIMVIVNSSGANWHYSTNAHCLVVNAIYSDKSNVQFADPLGGIESDWPVYYLRTSTVANSVCHDLIW